MRPPAERGEHLRSIPLFADWDARELSMLQARSSRRRWRRGESILRQSDPGNVAFVIIDGRVDILLEWPDGREFCLARLGPGDYFGEMALLDPEPRSASVRAAADTQLLIIRREDLLKHLLDHPPAMLTMLTSLSQRLRNTDTQIAGLAFDDTAARLGQILNLNAVPHPRGLGVDVSQSELATMVGATRQTVARILGEWRRQGLIETGRRRTIILQPHQLAAAARTAA
ncbi:MAG: Crp/Fnr family transcriptional regulator [Chloroflexi bacterium]|nr:Crp/Fnr family transcriptional regulator [Chloroflexota bacterium]MBV9896956.1 Crp/Fnr family transcriptional regulator [Chloroflexota bacterium]